MVGFFGCLNQIPQIRTMLEVIVSIDNPRTAEIESSELITVVPCGICSQRLKGQAGCSCGFQHPLEGGFPPQVPLGTPEYCVDPLERNCGNAV